jgi:2-alkyl-3-oxoalkanoate reductase
LRSILISSAISAAISACLPDAAAACLLTYRKKRRLPPVAKAAGMNIFLTGAAGLLGGALVDALIRAGHAVVGLVHQETDIRSNDGQSIDATFFDGSHPVAGALKLLTGDVRFNGLCLSAERQAWLTSHIDLVIHCAALVKFEADAAELEAVNVDGTRHVAELFPSARFIHISTAYVCGVKDGLITETPCDPHGAFGNGYEQSKARAEAVLRELRPDAIIVRPSIIVGEFANGRIRSFDTIYRAFKFIAEGKVKSIPASSSATLNFVPVDHVVGGICDIVAGPDARPSIIHLTACRAIPAIRFLKLIGEIPGLFSPMITEGTAVGIAERLAQPYWGYFRRSPEFESRRLESMSGRIAPDMDDAALLRQIRYCVDAGFIRTRATNACLAVGVL